MSQPATNCPQCNSMQRFAVHEREVDGTIQSFVGCKACGYELVIETFPKGERVSRQRENARKIRALRRQLRSQR